MDSRKKRVLDELTRPIANIEYRAAGEVFDMMCSRIRGAFVAEPFIDPRHFNILAEAMAEVKATSDGLSDQSIADIVDGCLAEIEALDGTLSEGTTHDAR
jgi:hypothetical protein